jgi:hypothetical protein
VPVVITSDRGSQFTSALWDSLCNILGIRHVQTTAYHPQSNGLVERFHRRLKGALRARLAGPTWTAHLPWVLLGLRAAPREEDNISPAQAVFGTPIVLPGQFLDENANVNEAEFFQNFSKAVGAAKIIPTRHNVARAQQAPEDLPVDLLRAEAVLVRRDGHVPPLAPLYNGPYRVLTRSRDFFRLQMGDRTDTVSTSRLKPCLSPAAVPSAPPRQGRPPGQRKDVTFRWPPARLAVRPPASVSPAASARTLAAAGPSTPPVPGAGTVFPHGQGFFARPDPGQEQRPSTPAGRPQRHRRPSQTCELHMGQVWGSCVEECLVWTLCRL